MIDAGVKVCPECLRPFEKVAQWDELTVHIFPPRAYWRGMIIAGMTPMLCRMLFTLAERGSALNLAMLLHLGEDTDPKTLDIHISRLNRVFRQAAVPVKAVSRHKGFRHLERTD